MKSILLVIVLALLPQVAFSQTPPAPPSPPVPQEPGKVEVVKPDEAQAQAAPKQEENKAQVQTMPGAIVYVRPFPKSLSAMSEADYGAFQTQNFSWDTSDFSNKGVKYGKNQFVVEVQTFLVVKEAGLYQFAIDYG